MKILFTHHPKERGMTYWVHLKHAFCMAFHLLRASTYLSIHTVFPFLFTTTASTIVGKINKQIVD